MDFKNFVIVDIQVGGFEFEFKMPAGCTFAAAHAAASEIAKNIELMAKQADEKQKAESEQATAEQSVAEEVKE